MPATFVARVVVACRGLVGCLNARRSPSTAHRLGLHVAADPFPRNLDVIVLATARNDIVDPAAMTAQVRRARSSAGNRPLLSVRTRVHRTIGAPTLVAPTCATRSA